MQLQDSRPAWPLLLQMQTGLRQGSRSCPLRLARLQMQVGHGLASAEYKPENVTGDRPSIAAQMLTDCSWAELEQLLLPTCMGQD